MRLILIAASVGALALGGCGGTEGETTAAGGGSREAKARDAALKFARCMRENGVDIPDPQVGESGGLIMRGPGGGSAAEEPAPPAKFRKAEEACRKHLKDLAPPKLSDAQKEEFRERALAHSRCMRKNGVPNFPDPQVGDGGEMAINIGGEGLDPASPAFRKAQKACDEGGAGVLAAPAGGPGS